MKTGKLMNSSKVEWLVELVQKEKFNLENTRPAAKNIDLRERLFIMQRLVKEPRINLMEEESQ